MAVPDDPYPEIGRILARSVSGPWDRIVFHAVIGDDWGQFEGRIFSGGASRPWPLRSEPTLLKLFQRVREITNSIAEPGQRPWTAAEFTLQRDGRFDIRFEYGA